jgi:hypothetical protein
VFRIALALLLLATPAFAVEPTHQLKLNGHTFTLPVGFEIELVAGSPLVERPNVAAFDGRGRGADNNRWPNVYFPECGLFCLGVANMWLNQSPSEP